MMLYFKIAYFDYRISLNAVILFNLESYPQNNHKQHNEHIYFSQ
jgi:hypothetical protein